MAELGRALIYLGLAVSIYGIGASLYGARARRAEWVESGRRAMYMLAGLMVIAFVLLEIAFLRNDFAFNVVAQTSATTIPTFYKLTAPWSSQQGSLLLWVMLLSLWSSLMLYLTRNRMREIAPYATAVLFGFATFFGSLAAFAANPFTTTPAADAPVQGAGLDPLLMHPSMMFHPPMLYSGYTLMAIPFAFAVGALVSGKLGSEWIRDTRRFALGAWLALGVGIILGARWSYTELGWGGYWGWDAVENAALMPWLTMTAFIHSIQIQEKRGMLRIWNVSLVLMAGTLSIFGTFLVRSGVLDSIHAFGASTLGIPFVSLLAVMLIGTIGLILWRRDSLRSEHQIDSMLSREAMFLLQNLVLVAMVFVIFWITLFPLISQAVTGTKVSVGPPAFTPFIVPLALILVLLTGIGPMISWRRATVANLRRNFIFPVAVGLTVAVLAVLATSAGSRPLAVAAFGLGAFVMGTVVQEVYRGTAARRRRTGGGWVRSFGGLIQRNRRRYGGYTVHFGFAVLLIGVAASSSFQHSRNATLRPGQSVSSDGYVFQYVRPTTSVTSERISFGAIVNVTRNGHHVVTLNTDRGYYPSTTGTGGLIGQFFDASNADSKIGLDAGPVRDIWSVVNVNLTPLAGLINSGNQKFTALFNQLVNQTRSDTPAQRNAVFASSQFWALRDAAVDEIASRYVTHPYPVQFLFIVSPLVTWLWGGAIIMVIGALIALSPASLVTRRRRTAGERRIAAEAALGAEVDAFSPLLAERLELEAARDAKLREIRDAELDRDTGKLSDADFATVDSVVRGEVVELLHRLDRVVAEIEAQSAPAEPDAGVEQRPVNGSAECDADSPVTVLAGERDGPGDQPE